MSEMADLSGTPRELRGLDTPLVADVSVALPRLDDIPERAQFTGRTLEKTSYTFISSHHLTSYRFMDIFESDL